MCTSDGQQIRSGMSQRHYRGTSCRTRTSHLARIATWLARRGRAVHQEERDRVRQSCMIVLCRQLRRHFLSVIAGTSRFFGHRARGHTTYEAQALHARGPHVAHACSIHKVSDSWGATLLLQPPCTAHVAFGEGPGEGAKGTVEAFYADRYLGSERMTPYDEVA